MRVLVSWIGHTDLRALAGDRQDDHINQLVSSAIGRIEPLPQSLGPVHSFLNAQEFDRVFLLANYSQEITDVFCAWLPVKVVCVPATLADPTDYAAVFRFTNHAISEIVSSIGEAPYELSFYLSPGTPAMTAVFVLLGKTRYPATFYQSTAQRIWETSIPFDVTLDFVPALLRGPDSNLQHLAAHAPAEIAGFESISGKTQAISLAAGRAKKAALRDVPVLLVGESGTGKEMFARSIHAASHRRTQPFEVVNCAAIPENLLESELFGHEKGAFTGAASKFRGAFERAHGGTLFLDEVGECTPALQAKLLRVLQPPPSTSPCTRVFRPIGAVSDKQADVRLIAATNRDLPSMMRDNLFREDLFYRLAVISIRLPALRERRADIQMIAERLLAQINGEFDKQEPGYTHKYFSDDAISFMVRHAWPGNVRELHNVILQAAVMSHGDSLTESQLQEALSEMPSFGAGALDNPLEHPLGDGFDLQAHLEAIHRHYLLRALKSSKGVKAEAARLLGLNTYQTLDAQLKRLQVSWEEEQ